MPPLPASSPPACPCCWRAAPLPRPPLRRGPSPLPLHRPPSRPPHRAGPTAEDRIGDWESAARAKTPGLRFERAKLGRFVASHYRDRFSTTFTGAVATADGLVKWIPWERLVSADKDVDGDGRADLVVTTQGVGFEERRRVIEVLADRPSGPASLPVKGVERFEWERFEWLDSPVPTLVLRPADSAFEQQIVTWDGTALVAGGPLLLRWDTAQSPHQAGANWFLTAMAGGKTVEYSVWNVGHVAEVSPPGALIDLRGDGERYYVVRFSIYPSPEIGGPLETSQLILELRKGQWAIVSAPLLDLAKRGDRDANGVPDFECSRAEVDLATCKREGPDCDTAPFPPPALATWSGDDLSTNTFDLKPIYAVWLKEALAEAATWKGPIPTGECPAERLATAVRVYLGRRWSGVDEAVSAKEVQSLMKGVSFAACAQEGSRGRAWPAVWKDLKRALEGALPQTP